MTPDEDNANMGDYFESWSERSAAKRAENRTASQRILAEEGIDFTSNNEGVHLVIVDHGNTWDFWPGTGKWSRRLSGRYARGVYPLIKAIKAARPEGKK